VAGLGICQLPEFYILPYLRRGMLELLLENMSLEDEPVWAVYPQRRHLLPKIQYAVDCLSRELSTIINSDAIGQQ
jgi:DNA-binding transcriptional LysR family regulator